MKGMLGSFFDSLSLVILERIQTCTDSSIKESDQDRQRNAEEVEDFRKQLAKAAAEACLHWLALAISDCVSLVMPEHFQTCTDSSIKESDEERQRNAEEVEDLRKQLSKAAAEACLHFGFLVVRETLHG